MQSRNDINVEVTGIKLLLTTLEPYLRMYLPTQGMQLGIFTFRQALLVRRTLAIQ